MEYASLAACVGAAGATAFLLLRPVVSSVFGGGSAEAEDFPGPGEGEVPVTVKQGDTGESIATTLRDAGVVKTRTAYLDASAADPQGSAGIQPGTYTMQGEMSAASALAFLLDEANRMTNAVTIPEGFRIFEVFTRLSEHTGVPVEDFEAIAELEALRQERQS